MKNTLIRTLGISALALATTFGCGEKLSDYKRAFAKVEDFYPYEKYKMYKIFNKLQEEGVSSKEMQSYLTLNKNYRTKISFEDMIQYEKDNIPFSDIKKMAIQHSVSN